jgi:lipopolysaccharide export system permease protein
MHVVWIYRRQGNQTQRIFADQGTLNVEKKALTLRLFDGQIERFSLDRPKTMVHIRFKEYTVQVPLGDTSENRNLTWREKTTAVLSEEMRKRRSQGISVDDIQAEYHLRLAVSFAPLALSLLGIPLGMTLERGGRGVGFGASVAVLFGYYLLLIMGVNLAERGTLPAPVALWTANVVALVIGAVLYRRRLHR